MMAHGHHAPAPDRASRLVVSPLLASIQGLGPGILRESLRRIVPAAQQRPTVIARRPPDRSDRDRTAPEAARMPAVATFADREEGP